MRPPARAVSQVIAFQLVMRRGRRSCQGQRPTRICPAGLRDEHPGEPEPLEHRRAEPRPGDEGGGRADLRRPAGPAGDGHLAEPARGGLAGARGRRDGAARRLSLHASGAGRSRRWRARPGRAGRPGPPDRRPRRTPHARPPGGRPRTARSPPALTSAASIPSPASSSSEASTAMPLAIPPRSSPLPAGRVTTPAERSTTIRRQAPPPRGRPAAVVASPISSNVRS